MIDRRTAMKAAMATALTGASSSLWSAENKAIKPPRLRAGDRIGIVAPASSVPEFDEITMANEIVESLGFEPVEGEHLYARTNYLAGEDRNRAADVNAMFADDSVDAIFCLRGGYGTTRMLPFLDYDVIRANPKVITGYSDITGLINAISVKTGLVTFHGPVAVQNFSDYTLSEYRKVLVEPAANAVIAAAPPFERRAGLIDKTNRILTITGGKARGRLVGGNLTLLTSINGTPYEPDYDGAILFLEDVSEAHYRIDRMLTELWLSGHLQKLAGVALGKFTETGGYGGNEFSLEDVFRMRFEALGIPTVRGLMIGHVEDQTTVPIGIDAELDADAGSIRLLEAAVT